MNEKKALRAIREYMEASLGVSWQITEAASRAINYLEDLLVWRPTGKGNPLPPDSTTVLTTVRYPNEPNVGPDVFIGVWCGGEGWGVDGLESDEYIVTAWKPLPDPYRESEGE